MRILVRTSKWAIWARRFGSFALPVAIIPVFMHRERMITSETFHLIEVVAMGIAALGLLLALGAFVRLWITGDQGWGKASLGLLFSLVCLIPPVAGIALALRSPPILDVSTDLADPPILVSGLAAPSPRIAAEIETRYPNVKTRSYPIDTQQIFAVALALAQTRTWEIVLRRPPQAAGDEGQINAIATTLLGWRDEVSIRVRGSADGSAVAMRSAALGAINDLDGNGRRIEEFLTALDAEVTVMLRDMPTSPPVPDPPPS